MKLRNRRLSMVIDGPPKGSSELRGHQLATFIRSTCDLDVRIIRVAEAFENRSHALWLTKPVLDRLTPDHLKRLRTGGASIIADPIDMPINETVLEADLVIASSRSQLRWLRSIGANTYRVDHHVDIRILPGASAPWRQRAAYFGKQENARWRNELIDSVDFHDASNPADTGWMRFLQAAPIHYALRPEPPALVFKPLTKALIASTCGSIVIIERSDDSEEAFGAKYPYLVLDQSLDHVMDIVTGFPRVDPRSDFNIAAGTESATRLASRDRILAQLAGLFG